MERELRDYLNDIIETVDDVDNFTADMSIDEF